MTLSVQLVPFQLFSPKCLPLDRTVQGLDAWSRSGPDAHASDIWPRSVGTALAVLLTLTWGATAARPQQAARLTLQSALELAAKQNLDLAAARQRRAVALAGVRIARQRPNPTANFTTLRDEPHEGLFFDQPIELGGKRQRRIELAQQEGAKTMGFDRKMDRLFVDTAEFAPASALTKEYPHSRPRAIPGTLHLLVYSR